MGAIENHQLEGIPAGSGELAGDLGDMKIICTDNYARETRSDRLICENISEYWGTIIVQSLNHGREHSEDFFRLVPDDHKLYVFNPC